MTFFFLVKLHYFFFLIGATFFFRRLKFFFFFSPNAFLFSWKWHLLFLQTSENQLWKSHFQIICRLLRIWYKTWKGSSGVNLRRSSWPWWPRPSPTTSRHFATPSRYVGVKSKTAAQSFLNIRFVWRGGGTRPSMIIFSSGSCIWYSGLQWRLSLPHKILTTKKTN